MNLAEQALSINNHMNVIYLGAVVLVPVLGRAVVVAAGAAPLADAQGLVVPCARRPRRLLLQGSSYKSVEPKAKFSAVVPLLFACWAGGWAIHGGPAASCAEVLLVDTTCAFILQDGFAL